MNISQGFAINKYYVCLEHLHSAVSAVYKRVISRATEERKNAEAGQCLDDLTDSGNGTWKKRGFSSLFGVRVGHYSNKTSNKILFEIFFEIM